MQTDHPLDAELQALRDRRLQEMTRLAAAPRGATPPVTPAPAAPTRPVTVTDATIAETVAAHPLVVVDAWAPWCGPCRTLGPILDDLARELAGRVVVAKLNVDENPRTAAQHRITGIPTMLVFRDGRLVDRVVGVLPKAALKTRFLAHEA